MTDLSETSSSCGDWEQYCNSQEWITKMEKMEQDMQNMKIEMEAKEKENALLLSKIEANVREDNVSVSEEIEKVRDEMKKKDKQRNEEIRIILEEKDKEIGRLRSKLENESTFSMEGWMKEQTEKIQMTSVKLCEKIHEVYKKIWEVGLKKPKAISASDRRKITDDIQKKEDLCEEITRDLLNKTNDYMEKITKHLKSGETLVELPLVIDKTGNLPIDSFLGTYKLEESEPDRMVWDWGNTESYPYRTIIFRKNKSNDSTFELCWKCENGKEIATSWIHDNVDRGGNRVWIEGNVLKRNWIRNKTNNLSWFELTERGFSLNGEHSFIRV